MNSNGNGSGAQLAKTAVRIFGKKSALLFCHARPDGDTIGSALALCNALREKGIKADVICEDTLPAKFSFLKGYDGVYNQQPEGEYDVHIACDCASPSMFGRFKQLFFSCRDTVNIDHHISNEKYAAENIVENLAAACELIYRVIVAANIEISTDAATCLLLGLVTDTGNFSQKNTTACCLETAGALVSLNADINDINYRMFKCQSKARALLYGDTIKNIKFFHDDRVAIIAVRSEAMARFGATSDMTEGFIDFCLTVESVEIAISVLEVGDKRFKVSFRSKSADVNAVARTFGGGGHTLASGCMINGFYEDVIDKLVFTAGNYL